MFRTSVFTASTITAVCASFVFATAQAATAQTVTNSVRPAATPASVDVWSRPFYVDPNSIANQVLRAQPTNTVAATLARIPQARWFTPDNSVATIRSAVAQYVSGAAATNTIPVLVTYAIPGRDCGSFSSGGLPDAATYDAWIQQVGFGIGANQAVVIIEPDALAQATDCLTATQQTARYAMLSYAAQTLGAGANRMVYLDGGHSRWLTTAQLASRLTLAGVRYTRGFSLNISNFFTTAEEQNYGEQVATLLGGNKFYVVDVSRNGQGPAPPAPLNWCNPSTAGLGALPTGQTNAAHDDANLWVKAPGQSDGNCAPGQPASGAWYQASATSMLQLRVGW
jgi:endoglucanase